MLTGQFIDKATYGQSSCGLVSSQTGENLPITQLANSKLKKIIFSHMPNLAANI